MNSETQLRPDRNRFKFIDLLLVAAGGFLGTALRVVLSELLPASEFPWDFFAINVTGSFMLGFLVGKLTRIDSSNGEPPNRSAKARNLRLFLGTGFLGGYTTYSSFASGVAGLLQAGQLKSALTYGIASLIIGVSSAFLGLLISNRRKTRQ